MANAFNKEERIAFENILEGFQDALVLSKAAAVYNTDSVTMERAADTIWRPQPYVSRSFAGTDMTSTLRTTYSLLCLRPWATAVQYLGRLLLRNCATRCKNNVLVSQLSRN